MKIKKAMFAGVLFALGLPAQAEVNCHVISSFDRLHDATVRISRYDLPSQRDLNANAIAIELAYLRNVHLGGALGSNFTATKQGTFQDFIDHSERLLALLSKGDRDLAPGYLQQLAVSNNLDALVVLLRSLPCSRYQPPVVFQTAQSASGASASRSVSIPWRDAVLPLFAVVLVFSLLLYLHRLRKNYRRRETRFAIDYETNYRVGGHESPGKLLDISGHGTKLRHDPARPIEAGEGFELYLLDEWRNCRRAWCNMHYTGARFEVPLTVIEVKKLRRAARA